MCYRGSATVMWASRSGGTLIGSLVMTVLTPKPHLVTDVGVFTKGEYRPLPFLSFLSRVEAELGEIAF